MTVLRDGLLDGRAVALAGGPSADIAAALERLGARVEAVPALDGADEERVGEWARSRTPLHALIYVAGAGDLEDLLADVWVAVREVATGALIPGGEGGKIVLVAPTAGAGPPSASETASTSAAQAGLENLARTLSVEWARFGVTVVAVAPGPHLSDGQLPQFVCYLVSVAGDYFSGTRFDLGRDLR
jgi:NAD(P)-dependent dehydrogenase (short-subunit alcohol dehydrogenase family)